MRLAAIGFGGLLILAVLGLVWRVGANVHKARIEAGASQALGMELRLGDEGEPGRNACTAALIPIRL